MPPATVTVLPPFVVKVLVWGPWPPAADCEAADFEPGLAARPAAPAPPPPPPHGSSRGYWTPLPVARRWHEPLLLLHHRRRAPHRRPGQRRTLRKRPRPRPLSLKCTLASSWKNPPSILVRSRVGYSRVLFRLSHIGCCSSRPFNSGSAPNRAGKAVLRCASPADQDRSGSTPALRRWSGCTGPSRPPPIRSLQSSWPRAGFPYRRPR